MSLHIAPHKKMLKQQTGMCSPQQKAFWTSREAMWHTGAAALAAGCISPQMWGLISEKSVTCVQGETSHITAGGDGVSSCLPTAKDTCDSLLIHFHQNQMKRPQPEDKSAG